MRRILAIVTALLLASVTFWDVYTVASDLVRPAPWWQLALELTDVSLLATVAGLVWRKSAGAHRVVLGDLLFVLGAFVLVRQSGVTRGFGADEYLSLFLVALAIRVGLYVALFPREARPGWRYSRRVQ